MSLWPYTWDEHGAGCKDGEGAAHNLGVVFGQNLGHSAGHGSGKLSHLTCNGSRGSRLPPSAKFGRFPRTTKRLGILTVEAGSFAAKSILPLGKKTKEVGSGSFLTIFCNYTMRICRNPEFLAHVFQ